MNEQSHQLQGNNKINLRKGIKKELIKSKSYVNDVENRKI